MRIADKMNYDQVQNSIGKNRTEMADLQNQAASQKRLNKPSDDPLAATRVLQTRTEVGSGGQFLKSVSQAKNFLEYSDQSLGELTDVLVRAKELAISQSSDASASESTRRVAATEVEQLLAQAVQVGNRKLGDRFLFGGYRTTKAPFDASGNYKGDSGEMKIVVGKEATVAMNIPGDRVFLGRSVQVPATTGLLTERAVEPNADRAIEQSGINSPALKRDSQAKDGQTIENDRPLRDSDQPLRGPASEVPAVTRPRARSDGPPLVPERAIVEEEQPHIGESWHAPGTNVFKVLTNLQIGLKANDKESVQESLDQLDEAIAQVVIARSTVGARVGTLNSAMDSLQKGRVDAKTLASNLEDADTFELVSDLNKTESTLKASLQTSGKLIQPSLLDFIR